ncbi:MAG: rhomboid family intramembrane serine protease [Firmicutes bacterium]|nr:rhomboid family intramembrane serine protease [Bacillota bacterium]
MFQDFSETLRKNLMERDYHIISPKENFFVTENTPFLMLARNMSPVLYTVTIINANVLNEETISAVTNSINISMETTVEKLRCSYAICLNLIVCSNDAVIYESFVDKMERVSVGRVNQCWWIADIKTKKLIYGKKQPTKLMDLENIINVSLNGKLIDESVAVNDNDENFTFTYSLIFINLIVWGYLTLTGSSSHFFEMFANDSLRVFGGEVYRLVTSMFFHSGLMHVAYNCLSIYIFGRSCEKHVGKAGCAAVYFLSGIFGGLASCFFTKGISVGASGGVFGMIGALLAYDSERKKDIDGLGYFTILMFSVFGILIGFSQNNVDNAAHIAGMAMGYLTERLLVRHKLRRGRY